MYIIAYIFQFILYNLFLFLTSDIDIDIYKYIGILNGPKWKLSTFK